MMMVIGSSPWYNHRKVAQLVRLPVILLLASTTTVLAFSPIFSASDLQQLNQQQAVGRRNLYSSSATTTTTSTELSMIFNNNKKKDDDDDLSFIETRDMTREEMVRYNEQFEDTVNQEIMGMTVFSLIISLPLLYLAWVGFFADTAEIAGEL